MLTHMGTKVIETKRLTLRPFSAEDADDMYNNWAADPEVTKYVHFSPHTSVTETKEILAKWISKYENPECYNWAMVLDGHAIGNVSIIRKLEANGSFEFGYCMSREHWNHGYMSEAVSAICDFFFREVGAHRLVIRHVTENPASGKVARKCGFTYEGCSRRDFRTKTGEYLDIENYSLLREDWEKNVASSAGVLTLDTPRLILRPAGIHDFEAVHSYAGSPENTYFMSWGTNTEKQTREYLLQCERSWAKSPVTDYEFVMVQKESGRVIGGCGMYVECNGVQANLGWILHRDFWKMGYTPEAARAMIDYAFETLGLHRVRATCDAENYGSYRVMEKAGMRCEALFRKVRFTHGVWSDELEYAILKDEWKK